MDYKILIVKNRFKKKLDFKRGFDWFSKNTPLKMVTEEINTDFDITFDKVGNHKYQGVIPSTKFYGSLRPLIPENKYHCVVLVYGNSADGIRVSACYGEPLYNQTEFISLCNVDDGGKTLNHELIHSFFKRLFRQGIILEDPMDTYLFNSDLKVDSVINTNREMALQTLKPYWDKVIYMKTKPIVYIKRNKSNSKQTIGKLKVAYNGKTFTCDTLELPDLNNLKNISCIPKGTYECRHTFSPRFFKFTYEILNVPNRSGIRIHSSNYYFQLNGCIALGNGLSDINKDGQLDVINSRQAISAFESILGYQQFTLVIE